MAKYNFDKKKQLALYTEIVSKVVGYAFLDETNELLLEYFRSYPGIMVSCFPDSFESKTHHAEFISSPEFSELMKAKSKKWARGFREKHPLLELDWGDIEPKLSRFQTYIDREKLNQSNYTDEEKLQVWRSAAIRLRKFQLAHMEYAQNPMLINQIDNVNFEIQLLEELLASPTSQSLGRKDNRIIWLKDHKNLRLLIKALSFRGFSPDTSSIERILSGENVPFQIKEKWLLHFVWLIHCLYQQGCIKPSRKGHFKVFEELLDWDYCNGHPKVSMRKVASKLNKDKKDPHPIKTLVSHILKEAKLSPSEK